MNPCSPPSPGVVAIEVNSDYLGRPIVNILHFLVGDAGAVVDVPTLTALATAADTAAPAFYQNLHGGVSYDRIVARDLSPGAGGQAVEISTHKALVGAAGGALLPSSVAIVVSMRTAQAGRSGRGRIYYGPLGGNGWTDANNMSQGNLTQIEGELNTFIAAIKAGHAGTQHVILSKWHNKACRAAGVTNVVTSIRAKGLAASQRRRIRPAHK